MVQLLSPPCAVSTRVRAAVAAQQQQCVLGTLSAFRVCVESEATMDACCFCVHMVHASGIEEKVAAATQEAEDEVDGLDAEADTQSSDLSSLRAEKQQLQKKVHVATKERGEMDHAARALGFDNVALHKAAEQLAAKIYKVQALHHRGCVRD